MPDYRSKYNVLWEKQTDGNGHRIGQWCRKSKTKSGAYCTLCDKEIEIGNAGIKQLKQHASGKKHKDVAGCKLSKSQTIFPSLDDSCSSSRAVFLTDRQKVLRAETLWTMKVAQSNYSYASCDHITELFGNMFDDKLIERMTLSSSKVSYLISDGLGPHFHRELVEDVRSCKTGYLLCYDETPNAQCKNQLDLLVRYWSPSKNEIVCRYLSSVMMGHKPAEAVRNVLLAKLTDDDIPLAKLLAVMGDGPNVNLATLRMMKESVAEVGGKLMDISTCTIHMVHNGFRNGLQEYGMDVEEFVVDVFFWFKSAGRREDYSEVRMDLELPDNQFIKHVSSRWLTLLNVVERIFQHYDGLVKYFEELKTEKGIDKKKRYNRIMRKLNQSDLKVQIQFLLSTEPIFQYFLTFLQMEGPLIHVLYTQMLTTLEKLMSRFIRSDVIANSSDITTIDCLSVDNQLPDEDCNFGEATRTELKKLSRDRRKQCYLSMKKFYGASTNYLLKKLPLKNKLLKAMTVMHPDRRTDSSATTDVAVIARQMPPAVMPQDEIDILVDEWKCYQNDVLLEGWSLKVEEKQRVDHAWRDNVFCLKNAVGYFKYPVLTKFVKTCLSIAHGNADVERGFSVNNNAVTAKRARLSTESVVGQRSIKDGLAFRGKGAHDVEVDAPMLKAVATAYSTYASRIEEERKEKEKEKEKENLEEKMSKEKREQQLRAEEERSKKLKKVEADEKKSMEDLRIAQEMMSDAGKKMSAALESSSKVHLTVAQTLLDTAKGKLDAAHDALTRAQTERKRLEKEAESAESGEVRKKGEPSKKRDVRTTKETAKRKASSDESQEKTKKKRLDKI